MTSALSGRVLIGASGGIGAALAEAMGPGTMLLGRRTLPALDVLDEASIVAAAESCGDGLRLVIDATGFLHDAQFQPEKSLRQLDPAHLARSFAINATGPALLMKHFLPLLARDGRAVFATLSARVGSISDNRLGGWYAYRASKAALNQLVRTAAVELARTRTRGGLPGPASGDGGYGVVGAVCKEWARCADGGRGGGAPAGSHCEAGTRAEWDAGGSEWDHHPVLVRISLNRDLTSAEPQRSRCRKR